MVTHMYISHARIVKLANTATLKQPRVRVLARVVKLANTATLKQPQVRVFACFVMKATPRRHLVRLHHHYAILFLAAHMSNCPLAGNVALGAVGLAFNQFRNVPLLVAELAVVI